MKHALAILVCLLACLLFAGQPPSALTETVSVSWSGSASPGVTNYTLWWGTNSGNYTASLDIGTNCYTTVTGLVRGVPYFFTLNCNSANGLASEYAPETNYTAQLRPMQPGVARPNRQ